MLLGKFRDDVAESLEMELPPLPQRRGRSRSPGWTTWLLREFRDALVIEKADRTRIADERWGKARAS